MAETETTDFTGSFRLSLQVGSEVGARQGRRSSVCPGQGGINRKPGRVSTSFLKKVRLSVENKLNALKDMRFFFYFIALQPTESAQFWLAGRPDYQIQAST